MAAPKGNQFWKLRSKHGRDKIFATPELMLEAAYEYFKWSEDNPLIEIDYRGANPPIKIELPKMRALTMEGLAMFMHVNTVYFNHFEKQLAESKDELSKDFSKVITHVREVIRNQKFQGAAAGFLNPNIIARDLGLKENMDHTTGGEKMNTLKITVTSDEAKKALEHLNGND
jgi:hypothetical protein